jgi:hypothetical protein
MAQHEFKGFNWWEVVRHQPKLLVVAQIMMCLRDYVSDRLVSIP